MATYTQWRAGGGKVARVMYLSGPSQVLQAEVLAELRSRFPGAADTYWAGEDPEPDIWSAASTYPDDPATARLIVVHRADKLRSFAALPAILGEWRAMPNCTLLLASEEADYPPAGTVHGDLLRKSTGALLILAEPPKGDALARWAAQQIPGAPEQLGAQLVQVTGGVVEDIRDLATSLAAFMPEVSPSARLAQDLAADPAGDFAASLVAGDRKGAHAAAARMSRQQLGRAIGLLASWLDSLAILQPAAVRGETGVRELGRLGVPAHHVALLQPHAARYGPARIRYARTELLACAQAHRDGVPVAPAASVLAAGW